MAIQTFQGWQNTLEVICCLEMDHKVPSIVAVACMADGQTLLSHSVASEGLFSTHNASCSTVTADVRFKSFRLTSTEVGPRLPNTVDLPTDRLFLEQKIFQQRNS